MTGPSPVVVIDSLEIRIGELVISRVPTLSIAEGGCAAIIGESGSGKTTTLMAVLGLAESMGATVSGSIRVHDVEVVGARSKTLRSIRGHRVGMVPQNAQLALNPTLRIGTTLRRALKIHRIEGADAKVRIEDALNSVLLSTELLARYPHEVSGGQAQRVAIALSLALGVELIVADEPTSALDVTVQAEIVGLLGRIRRQRCLTLLLVSHDLAVVGALADHVLVMKDGAVVESGSPDQLFTAPKTPYTAELVAAVPQLDDVEVENVGS